VDGAGAPVRPPLAGAETQAGGRQYWASGVCGLGVPGAETDGGGPKTRRRILRPDGAETDGGGPAAHRRILKPDGRHDKITPERKGE